MFYSNRGREIIEINVLMTETILIIQSTINEIKKKYCMKTTKIIRNKKEVMKKLLTSMHESVCTLKEMLELLLDEYESEEDNQTEMDNEPRELIKGITGLANYLGCGTTKAQEIMNSGILQERDIAYRAGNRWRFNKTLLTRLLQKEPEILNAICSDAA